MTLSAEQHVTPRGQAESPNRNSHGRFPWARSHGTDLWPPAAAVVVVAMTIVVAGLIGMLLWMSLLTEPPLFGNRVTYTLQNYWQLLSDRFVWRVVLNTAIYTAVATTVAMTLGFAVAWLVERTDFRRKGTMYTVITLGMVLPTFLVAMGWSVLLAPRGGILNEVFHHVGVTFDVTSLLGMALLQGVLLIPISFIITAAALRNLDVSGGEAAAMSGANRVQTLRRVTLPVLKPSLYGALIYVVIIGFGAFDVPAILGLKSRTFVFSTYIYDLVSPQAGQSQYQIAAAVGVLMLIIGFILSCLYSRLLRSAKRYATVSGKTHRIVPSKLGRRGNAVAWTGLLAYAVIAVVLPVLALIWVAFSPVQVQPSPAAFENLGLGNFRALPWSTLFESLKNTILLMVIVPTVALFAVALPFTWTVLRSRYRFRSSVDQVAFIPHVIPHILFSFAMLIFGLFVVRGAFAFYGTLWIIGSAFIVSSMSFATRMTNGAWIQLGDELEEAGIMSGLRWSMILRLIVVPLLRPALVGAWLWIALLTYRELTIPALLSGANNSTFPVVVFSLWSSASSGVASATALVFAAALAPVVMLYWRLTRGRTLQV